jgi:hypothetical protein
MNNHSAAPVDPHLQTLHAVLNGWAMRATTNGLAAANLIPNGLSPRGGLELLNLQAAMFGKLWRQQQAWWQDWEVWAGECGQIKRANTVSKLVEQDLNLVLQLGQLVSNHTTELVGLLENFAFNCDYWLSEKLNATPGTSVADRASVGKQ